MTTKTATSRRATPPRAGAKAAGAHAPAAPSHDGDPHDHLRRVDPRLALVMDRHGPSPLGDRAKQEQIADLHFAGLVRAIVSQQLSSKAADTIYGRLEALGEGGLPAAADLVAMPDEKLRAVGLSGAKTRGVKDLAARVANGTLRLDAMDKHDDEAVIEALTQVKGVGRWTAEMFLMFRLGRLDVLSTADLGLRKGMMHLFELGDLPDSKRMEELAAVWRPFRSVASWYLWRVAEGTPPHRVKKVAAKKKPAAKKVAAKKSAAKKASPKSRRAKR